MYSDRDTWNIWKSYVLLVINTFYCAHEMKFNCTLAEIQNIWPRLRGDCGGDSQELPRFDLHCHWIIFCVLLLYHIFARQIRYKAPSQTQMRLIHLPDAANHTRSSPQVSDTQMRLRYTLETSIKTCTVANIHAILKCSIQNIWYTQGHKYLYKTFRRN